jgi:tetratricopeptide (TPR) repeat protein
VIRRSFVALLVLATFSTTAQADPKAAHEHVQRATAAYAAGKYKDALSELTLAYALAPDPQILFAIGQVHVKLGDCDAATAFYRRFLDTHPAADDASVAREAIDKCARTATKPEPTPEPEQPPSPPPPPPPPAPTEPPSPALAEAPPPPAVASDAVPWYRDPVGDTLVITGIAGGAVAGTLYAAALSARSQADRATTYGAYHDDLDRAHSLRTYSIVAGVAGGVLALTGVLRYGLHDRGRVEHVVSAVPTRGGALVTLEAAF